ncbi:hypothetical protein Z946_1200 [Sulfitobacter noctilucicola]|uniref:Uncharacterized protein n=1 Tax=Sulfitobacter noctilucicola TaxID=1342301 RepID=A0A7W6Q322_9RHOB|nr:hypothetical protein [Sulfitobacter noctilucicola]KIN62343.1 hypothetical protein Z946_1200 [Sulfitobacter noctilucicola]MBB4173123.1 hypothetical protein [Sulfitobacter noctilucicola]
MTLAERNPHEREKFSIVKNALVSALIDAIRALRNLRKRPHIKDLPERLRRDVAVAPETFAAYDHRLPSQHSHHSRS